MLDFSKWCHQFGGAIEQSRNSKLLGDSYNEMEVASGAEVVTNKMARARLMLVAQSL